MLNHPRPHFGTDGVRGTVGVNLSPQYAFVLGKAIAYVLGNESHYVVGRDTRVSGKVLSNALILGLVQENVEVQNVGIVSTPGVAAIAQAQNSFCCVITASHNPAEDNGIKVFGLGGLKISESIESEIENKVTELLEANADEEYDSAYINEEFSGIGPSMYVANLHSKFNNESFKNISVVLDCSNGAAYGVAPVIFEMLDADVTVINNESDGININNNCGATHLDSLIEKVLETKADIGFAFDGDADRLMIIDNEGEIRDGDHILALFAIDLKDQDLLTNNTVVATSMSNGGLRNVLTEHSIEFVETQVGDKYVAQSMSEKGAVLGGEQSGHIIRQDYAPWGDGVLNALLVLSIFARKRKIDPTISSKELLNLFVPMAQVHDKVKVADKTKSASDSKLLEVINQEKTLLGDGARIIVRPSGTEDVVRITVEANDGELASKAAKSIKSVIEEVCG